MTGVEVVELTGPPPTVLAHAPGGTTVTEIVSVAPDAAPLTTLDGLSDVDTAGALPGQVLTRTADSMWRAVTPSAGASGAPSGPAGGALSGTYPNPGFAVDMATHAELVSTVDSRVAMHVWDDRPHPAYDDLPSLTLLFENGLV